MSEQDNVRLIEGIYGDFARGDIAAVLATLAPVTEVQFEAPQGIPWAGNWLGSAGWAGFFQALGENADEITVAMMPFASTGDNVVMLGRYQARVKATGKRIDVPLVHLWTVVGDKVARCVELTNTAAELAACTMESAASR